MNGEKNGRGPDRAPEGEARRRARAAAEVAALLMKEERRQLHAAGRRMRK